jgi:cytochrome P450
MPLRDLGRSSTTWAFAHGLQRRTLRASARRGDPIARLVMDPQVSADPFAAYADLRSRGRLVTTRLGSATVDHALVNQVLRSDHFGTAAGHAELPPALRRLLQRVADPHALSPVEPPSLLAVDPPDHTRYRRLVAGAFTARRVGGLEERITQLAGRLLDEVEARGDSAFDVVDRFAARLPVAVIADLLGVPDAEQDQLLRWGNQAAVTLDPGLSWKEFRTAERALRSMHHWFDEHVGRLRRSPGDDLLSHLVQLDGDDRLTDHELRALGLLVLGAGFETTVNLIGNAVVTLDDHPEQRALLLTEPQRWPDAVEEVLRHDSPVQMTVRSAYTDTEVDGIPVAAGQGIVLFLGGANRDPRVFADPDTFDITRPNAGEHLSFSAGVHFCLGASLARIEAVCGLRTLYERHPRLQVSGTPVRRPTRVLRGYEHVPVASCKQFATTRGAP